MLRAHPRLNKGSVPTLARFRVRSAVYKMPRHTQGNIIENRKAGREFQIIMSTQRDFFVSERYARVVHQTDRDRQIFRLCYFARNADDAANGLGVLKFGISHSAYSEKHEKWFPAKKGNAFIPFSALGSVKECIDLVSKFDKNGFPALTTSNGGAENQRGADGGPAAKRQRGRPPKRATEPTSSADAAAAGTQEAAACADEECDKNGGTCGEAEGEGEGDDANVLQQSQRR